jgi:hypothetical protein
MDEEKIEQYNKSEELPAKLVLMNSNTLRKNTVQVV